MALQVRFLKVIVVGCTARYNSVMDTSFPGEGMEVYTSGILVVLR
jgi:hypothetical protein